MYLTVDLETSGGIDGVRKLVELLMGRVTVYVNGVLLEEQLTDKLDFLKTCDVELHGYHHVHLSTEAPLKQRAEIERAKEIYRKVFGFNPRGWRSPFLDFNRDTLRLLREYGFRWDSSYEQSPITWLRRFQAPLHLFPIHHKWFTGNPYGTTLLHCFEITERVLDTLQDLLEQGTVFETHAQAYGKVAH